MSVATDPLPDLTVDDGQKLCDLLSRASVDVHRLMLFHRGYTGALGAIDNPEALPYRLFKLACSILDTVGWPPLAVDPDDELTLAEDP